MIENHTKEEMSLSKQRESRHPVTASSGRSTIGSIKSRRSTTEKRSCVGDKQRSSHKEDKDINNTKPIISVNASKDEKKEEEKQIKDKLEAGNKQRFVCTRSQLLILYPFIGKLKQEKIYDYQLKKKNNF